jgi:hypothetical protein
MVTIDADTHHVEKHSLAVWESRCIPRTLSRTTLLEYVNLFTEHLGPIVQVLLIAEPTWLNTVIAPIQTLSLPSLLHAIGIATHERHELNAVLAYQRGVVVVGRKGMLRN